MPSQTPSVITPPCASRFRELTDEERQASLQRSLAHWQQGEDVWVFAYGSLIWRPEFEYTERRLALLAGYHRALCLWSRINRGTPERPGLVFALDHGGSCRGMTFRIPAARVPETMDALWRREMPGGAYIPRWLNCRTTDGPIKALTFTMNRATDAYVRDLPPEHLVRVIHQAHGRNGPCLEYVLETARALTQFDIHDQRLQTIVRQLHCPVLRSAA